MPDVDYETVHDLVRGIISQSILAGYKLGKDQTPVDNALLNSRVTELMTTIQAEVAMMDA